MVVHKKFFQLWIAVDNLQDAFAEIVFQLITSAEIGLFELLLRSVDNCPDRIRNIDTFLAAAWYDLFYEEMTKRILIGELAGMENDLEINGEITELCKI